MARGGTHIVRPVTSLPARDIALPRRLLVTDAGMLFVLALVANYIRISAGSVGLDEASSINAANSSGLELRWIVTSGENMSMYYVLLNVWVRIFGDTELAVRSLSAIAAALAVPAIYLLGSRLFGRMAGLTAGTLLAVNAFMVQFAQTARSYAVLALLVILSSWFFVRELERPETWNRVGHVVVSALAFGVHFFAAMALVAQAIVLLSVRRSGAFTRTWLGMGAAIAVLCAPTIWRAQRTNRGQTIDWIEHPTGGEVVRLLTQFAGGSTLLLLALLALASVAIVAALRRKPAWPVGFVAAWFAVPIVLSFAVSMVKPVFVSYYLIASVPALVLLAAAGIAELRPRPIGALAVALMAMLSGWRVTEYYRREVSENWREATRFVLAEQQPGDAIVFFPPYAPAAFAYYVRRHGAAGRGPTDAGWRPSSGDPRVWLAIRASDSTVQRAGLEQRRLAIQQRYRLENRQAFRGVAIELYVQSSVR